jgi:hypothetical protein
LDAESQFSLSLGHSGFWQCPRRFRCVRSRSIAIRFLLHGDWTWLVDLLGHSSWGRPKDHGKLRRGPRRDSGVRRPEVRETDEQTAVKTQTVRRHQERGCSPRLLTHRVRSAEGSVNIHQPVNTLSRFAVMKFATFA